MGGQLIGGQTVYLIIKLQGINLISKGHCMIIRVLHGQEEKEHVCFLH